MRSAACQALSQLSRVTALPLPENLPEGDEALSKRSLVDRLMAIVKANKSGSKVKERAISACGHLCLGEEFPYAETILRKFLELSKEVIIIFT